jgi:hypothetical protein
MTYPQGHPPYQHQPQYQPPPVPPYPPPPPGYYQQQTTKTTTRGGLPVWVHLLYGFLGWIPCFLGWIIWPIHWWFAQKKSVTTTHYS